MQKLIDDKIKIPGIAKCEDGTFAMMIGNERLWVFINNDTGQLDLTIDALGDDGKYDENIEWRSFNIQGEPISDKSYIALERDAAILIKESRERQSI